VKLDLSGIARANLPVKITGIVFWGLVIIGLTISYVLLRVQEQQVVERYQISADRFVYQLNLLFDDNPGIAADPEAASREITRLLAGLDIPAAALRADEISLSVGKLTPSLVATRRGVTLTGPDRSAFNAEVTIYQNNLRGVLIQQRKQMLIVMGAVFLVFGFILQWVLQRILSRPFMGMVKTAEGFSSGDIGRRFDEDRDDEFGYLAKFINKALDYVMVQQDELREALARERESEAALVQEKERAEVTLHSIGDGVVTTDAAGNIVYMNAVAERLTGYRLYEVTGRPIGDMMCLIDEMTREPVENPALACLRDGTVVNRVDHMALVRHDGEEVAIADSAAPIRGRDGCVLGAIMVFSDVGHTRKLARQLSFQASHDALSGLFNRREFEQQLQYTLDNECDDGQHHAVCYLDLDQFKVVNDTCGHVAGDELLRQLAGLLHNQVRESDMLARLGGDEFGVLLKYCPLDQAVRIAEDLRAKVKDFRFVWEDHSFEVGVSIGLAEVTHESSGIADIMSVADVACYAAKDSGRNRVHVYTPDDSELKQRRGEMRWVSRLRKAIDENRFRLYYQTIMPVAQPAHGGEHFEILIRLLDESGQEVPPMAFIPAAERYNLMPAIDRWVISTTMNKLQDRLARDPNWLCVINLSGQSLCDERFLDFVIGELDRHSIDPGQICFEITETAAIANLRRAVHFMSELKALGCRFALDDFGSGLSSFAYLKNLKVDYLKIDGSFVRDMVDDPIDRAMVEAITQIGHVMGIQTIGEFVEDEAILNALLDLQVDFAQGYWIAKPRPLHELGMADTEKVLTG
jgi:diguanylate cyclase (GGDEF)-like protein/PAS domain S-box-containing protein